MTRSVSPIVCCKQAFDAGELQFFSSLEACRVHKAFLRHIAPIRKEDWVVYAKRPFAGPEEVLKYVTRYTHRVAISNNRLFDVGGGKVALRWRVYRDSNQHKTMTLGAHEFIRRFLLHVLPDGFHRIRYFGFLVNRYRSPCCRQLLQMPPPTAIRLPGPWGRRSLDLRGLDHLMVASSLLAPSISTFIPLSGSRRMTLVGALGHPSAQPR